MNFRVRSAFCAVERPWKPESHDRLQIGEDIFPNYHVYAASKNGLPSELIPTVPPSTPGKLKGKSFVLCTRVEKDNFTNMLDCLFDSSFDGRSCCPVPPFPMEGLGSFQVGYICGPSGSLKSVTAQLFFGPCSFSSVTWEGEVPILEHFSSVSDAEEKIRAVGLQTVRLKDRFFHQISKGEQKLATIARLLGKDRIVIDEISSGLDYASRHRLAAGLLEYTRKNGTKGLVLVGCDHDIIMSLRPDWVFHSETQELFRRDDSASTFASDAPQPERTVFAHWSRMIGSKRTSSETEASGEEMRDVRIPAPRLHFELRACEPTLWRLFKDHHYKSESLSKKARTFALLRWSKDFCGACKPIGFAASIRHNLKKSEQSSQPPMRAHRTVIHPTWQGFGLGGRLSAAVGEVHKFEGGRFFGQTVHPLFGRHRDRSPLWKPTGYNHKWRRYKIENWKQRKKNIRIELANPRYVYSHEYVGAHNGQARSHLQNYIFVDPAMTRSLAD